MMLYTLYYTLQAQSDGKCLHGEYGGLMVSIGDSQHTGCGFDTNYWWPFFVSLGMALSLYLLDMGTWFHSD